MNISISNLPKCDGRGQVLGEIERRRITLARRESGAGGVQTVQPELLYHGVVWHHKLYNRHSIYHGNPHHTIRLQWWRHWVAPPTPQSEKLTGAGTFVVRPLSLKLRCSDRSNIVKSETIPILVEDKLQFLRLLCNKYLCRNVRIILLLDRNKIQNNFRHEKVGIRLDMY